MSLWTDYFKIVIKKSKLPELVERFEGFDTVKYVAIFWPNISIAIAWSKNKTLLFIKMFYTHFGRFNCFILNTLLIITFVTMWLCHPKVLYILNKGARLVKLECDDEPHGDLGEDDSPAYIFFLTLLIGLLFLTEIKTAFLRCAFHMKWPNRNSYESLMGILMYILYIFA